MSKRAARVPAGSARAFAAAPDGLEYLAFEPTPNAIAANSLATAGVADPVRIVALRSLQACARFWNAYRGRSWS